MVETRKEIYRITLLFWFLFLLMSIVSCSGKKPIKIGFSGCLSGRGADLGMGGLDGALLAMEEQNARGGINGRPILFLIRDDQNDPTIAIKVDQQLLNQGVSAIIGHMTSITCLAVAPLMTKNKTVMISPTSSTSILSGIDDYLIRIHSSSVQLANKLAEYTYQTKKPKSLVIAMDQTDKGHADIFLDNFKDAYSKLGGSVPEVVMFESGPNIPFLALTQKIMKKEPDCVFLLAKAMDTAMFCQQFQKENFHPTLLTVEWATTPELIEYGGKSVNGLLFSTYFNKNNQSKSYTDFKKRFEDRFDEEPGFASMYAYDAAMVLFRSMRENPDLSSLKETILQIKTFSGLQGSFTIGRTGDVERKLFMMQIQKGHSVIVE